MISYETPKGFYDLHELPLWIVIKLHAVAVAVAKFRHPRNALTVRRRVEHLRSVSICLDERPVGVSDQLGVKASGSLIIASDQFMSVCAPVTVHSKHAAASLNEQ